MMNGVVDSEDLEDDLKLQRKLEAFLPFLSHKYLVQASEEDVRADEELERALDDLDKIQPSHSELLKMTFTLEETEDKVDKLIDRLGIRKQLDRFEGTARRIQMLNENIVRTNEEIGIEGERAAAGSRTAEIQVQKLKETKCRMELQALAKKEMALSELLTSKLFTCPVSVMCPTNVEQVGQSCIQKLETEKDEFLRELEQRSPVYLTNAEGIRYDLDPWSYRM